MNDPTRSTTEVVVGRVGRAHGIRGDVAIDLRTDEPNQRFVAGAVFRLQRDGRTSAQPPFGHLEVATVKWHSGRLLVRFVEAADRTVAETLTGHLLFLDVPTEAKPTDPEEFYDHQLIGLRVQTLQGAQVGVISEISHSGAQDLLVIERSGRDPGLVPFVAALVPSIDLAAGVVVVADRPGLLEPLED